MSSSPRARHYEGVLREAAQRLADVVSPYRVLTREDLETLADVKRWRTVDFTAALRYAVELGLLRPLAEDLYEIPRHSAHKADPDTA